MISVNTQYYVGTSGFSYKAWKGNFYPETIRASDMLRFYGERLPAVELNNTFYRMPRSNVLESWSDQVPVHFRFAIKASRRITHIKRLKDVTDETKYLLDKLKILGERLGVILFQLPPYLRKDVSRLKSFLDRLPETTQAAFEFRHESWYEDDVLDLLRDRNLALCVADTDNVVERPTLGSANWGYLRLRRAAYSPADLVTWNQHIVDHKWEEAYVFFKHEDAGAGPKLAERFLQLHEPSPAPRGRGTG